MKKTLNIMLLLSVFLCMTSFSAFGLTTYTLQDLARIADKHSENIKIAEDDLYIAVQQKKRALSVLIPRVTTYGAMTNNNNDDMSNPDTLTVGIKLNQSFTLNGKELIAYDVTKKGIQSKEFSLESVRSQYFLQVAQVYYNILSAQKFFDIARSDVERLKTHRDAVKEKLNVGNVTKTDLYRAEAELSKSLTELVKAENAVLQTKAVLKNLVEIDEEFELAGSENRKFVHYATSLDEIETFALSNRTEIKEARKNFEIAQKTVRYEKSDYWPSLSLEAGYKETDVRYDSNPSDVESDSENLYITGQLTFTLFDGGLRRATIRQAAADERKAKNALSLTEKQIILDSKTSFLEYQTAKSTLKNLQEELKSAQENYKAVKMQFRYGMADSIDMMDANTLLVSAERRISDARYTYYLAVLKILYTRGDLVTFLSGDA